MPTSTSEAAPLMDALRQRAMAEGFADIGFTRPDAIKANGEHLKTFIDEGRHGDMAWLADRLPWRSDPAALWPQARTIIMLTTNYGPDHDPLDLLADGKRGVVSAYAARRDYHDVVKKRLKALGRWLVGETGCEIKVFVDTAPVMEKPLAQAAGLGWQGKHTNLVSRSGGSWTFLGAIFTTLDLTPDNASPDHCGTCSRCLDICPTAAFPAPYQLDARRCLAYLTVEHQGPIPVEFRQAIGNRIFGCDDCLAVCPWNRFAETSRDTRLALKTDLLNPDLAELLSLDDAAFRQKFSQTPVKRLGRNRFLRNVLVAAGNSGDVALKPQVIALLSDPSPLVRAMAVWALRQLSDEDGWQSLRRDKLPEEHDPDVLAEWHPERHPIPESSLRYDRG